MPSPFPGMNPYLEQNYLWQDFHQSFIPLIREILSGQVRPGYIVRVEEYLFIHELADDDVSVSRNPDSSREAAASTVPAAPARSRWTPAVDLERHSFVEVRNRHDRELVTVIELLSPSNKRPGADRAQYLSKRRQLWHSAVHLVEIDLLRGYPRLPLDDPPECDYYAMVSRAEQRPEVEMWSLRLRDHLPMIPVPLRPKDPDARLDLQAILHRVYDAAGYEDYIYETEPQPPLAADDAAWARQFLPVS
jgi:PIN domain nuclease of toxin-antitoxin system